ncbi:efflux RND transporter periplasmic adaptor subunit [Anaerospora sp.]|uniref:efflux RND transporter periplasmic adaptor subunit n=1 Tax=Anaerospora sp. TaxID=1960278 RepID=UPI002897A4EE|nr:efflux RND transporter periplasmic adaptor subunit [Anaerospora sp.]
MLKQMKATKWMITLVLLAGLVGGGYAYYAKAVQNAAGTSQETVIASKGNIASNVSATGTVKPIEAVDISSKVAGLIKELKVKENDTVKVGQVLAILEDTTLETTLSKAKYQVENTGAKYKRLQYLHSIGAKSGADLEDALLNYQTALASYDAAKSSLNETVLVSPIDGVVMGEPASVGTLVTAGVNDPTVVMMIGNLSGKMIKVKVDETDIGKIKVGQEAAFTVDAYQNQTFSGRVSKIGQISTATTTTNTSSSTSSSSSSTSSVIYYYVTLEATDPDNLLKPEMTARVTIKIDEKKDALLIPLAALKTTISGQSVTVLRDNGKSESVPVAVGITSGDKVEITEGLNAGDKLIISYTKTESKSSTKQNNSPPPPM